MIVCLISYRLFCSVTKCLDNLSFLLNLTEPDDYPIHKRLSVLTGPQVGHDFVILRKLLDEYEDLRNCSVIGPNNRGPGGKLSADIISGFVDSLSNYIVISGGNFINVL